jgi:hypothetical protein
VHDIVSIQRIVSPVTVDISAETFTRGKPRKDPNTGLMIEPKEYKRSGATVNRYLAALSHALSRRVRAQGTCDGQTLLHLVVDHKAEVIERMIAAKGL